jgi:glycosyltransferase involved in cell wall biosynthesis
MPVTGVQTCALPIFIMTSYNSENTITNAIRSIINQTYTNIELIVIDGSANQDAENLYANKENIIYVKSADSHPNVLRNLGIDCASGDLIAYLDEDDEFDGNVLILYFSYLL